jgi:hypothetical protein
MLSLTTIALAKKEGTDGWNLTAHGKFGEHTGGGPHF